ncbi:MAG: cyclic lactone autoinducer peptide [Ruminococcus flavefaciens]|nr:cyclic lactone autoinducer peptide [Ruminococcus flavefaciens]MCM1440379.1 cyclic lactone autoinducer peptide [Roseburia sp.]
MKKVAIWAAKIAKKAAVIAGGQASQWGGYQPQEPKNLKK